MQDLIKRIEQLENKITELEDKIENQYKSILYPLTNRLKSSGVADDTTSKP